MTPAPESPGQDEAGPTGPPFSYCSLIGAHTDEPALASTKGGVRRLPARLFIPRPEVDTEPFERLWQKKVFALLLQRGKIDESLVR